MKKNKRDNYIKLYNSELLGEHKNKIFYRKKKLVIKRNYYIYFFLLFLVLIIPLLLMKINLIKLFKFSLITEIIKNIKFKNISGKQYNIKLNENKNKEKNIIIKDYNEKNQTNNNMGQVKINIKQGNQNISLLDRNIIESEQWKNEKLVIHALGEYNKIIYSNSYEGLNYYHLIKKMNLLEADFILTKDDHIVSAHDYDIFNYSRPSFQEFKNARVKGNLTLLSFEDIVKYMYVNKELYIITDTKYTDLVNIEKEFNEMTKILNNYENVNERFIIEDRKNIHLIISFSHYIKDLIILIIIQKWKIYLNIVKKTKLMEL